MERFFIVNGGANRIILPCAKRLAKIVRKVILWHFDVNTLDQVISSFRQGKETEFSLGFIIRLAYFEGVSNKKWRSP